MPRKPPNRPHKHIHPRLPVDVSGFCALGNPDFPGISSPIPILAKMNPPGSFCPEDCHRQCRALRLVIEGFLQELLYDETGDINIPQGKFLMTSFSCPETPTHTCGVAFSYPLSS
jgi:hypothetical protein